MDLRKKKRILLIGLSSVLAMTSLTGCQKKSEDTTKKATNMQEAEGILDEWLKIDKNKTVINNVKVENEKGIWQEYKSLHSLVYHLEDGTIKTLFMVPEINSENETIYRSITNPKIYLVQNLEGQHLENNSLLENEKKDYIKNNIPLKFATCFANEISYEEAVQTEEEFAKMYNKSVTIAQDANNEWKIYQEIAYVIYETEETFEKETLVMGLEQRNDNQSLYRSLTTPEITLVVTQNKETYEIEYSLLRGDLYPENKNKEFTDKTNVISLVSRLGGSYTLHFEEIQTFELELYGRENNETNRGR